METAPEVAAELREFVARFRKAVRREPPSGAGEEYREWLGECRGILCDWCDVVRRHPELSKRFVEVAGLHKSDEVKRLLRQLLSGVRSACTILRRQGSGVIGPEETKCLGDAEELVEQHRQALQEDAEVGDRTSKRPEPRSLGTGRMKRRLQELEGVSQAHGGLGGTAFADAVRSARMGISDLDSLVFHRLEGERHAAAYYLLATYHAFAVSPWPEFGADVDDWPRVVKWFRENADNAYFVSAPGASSPGDFELWLLEDLTNWLAPEEPGAAQRSSARPVDAYRFRRLPGGWHIVFRDKEMVAPDTRGFRYIAELLLQGGRPLKCADLDALYAEESGPPKREQVESDAEDRPAGRRGRQGTRHLDVIDDKALQDARRQIQECDEGIENARKTKDDALMRKLEANKEHVVRYLAESVGPDGLTRLFSSEAQRVAGRVRKAVETAIKHFGTSCRCPELATHLDVTITREEPASYGGGLPWDVLL